MKKILFFVTSLLILCRTSWAIDAAQLLPAEEAFVPQVQISEQGANVQFSIAEGYYLYQSKILAETQPANLFAAPHYSQAEEKEDEFFGRQNIYHHAAQILFPFNKRPSESTFELKLSYQGCAEAGVCYPPVETVMQINGNGVYGVANSPSKGKNRFIDSNSNTIPTSSKQDSSRFKLSWETLNANLLAFFLAGLGLSFTACMYPLLPIVSSIIVGGGNPSKGRAFILSIVYVQGLALTYTLVGVIAGLTGALLTVWLQQAWVVLAAAILMVVLALSMFGIFQLQLPSAVQSYFQNQSSKLNGGKLISVFAMGALSALIVGPCVAPPLAFALGYIGQTGDGLLGGLALYTLALGTGVPLILIGTFGGHILPKAGSWMNGIKYTFGFILLAVAVYLATPFLPYSLVLTSYTALLLIPAILLLRHALSASPTQNLARILGIILLLQATWFGYASIQGQTTPLHDFLTLTPANKQSNHGHIFTNVVELENAMQNALAKQPNSPILLDFYADWCVSCKEMATYTLNQPKVLEAVDMERFFQIDVTANTPEQQALLKKYGLFGPPGVFVIHADGTHSEPLLGFVKPDAFIEWYQANLRPSER